MRKLLILLAISITGFFAGGAIAQTCSGGGPCESPCNGYDGAFLGPKVESTCVQITNCPSPNNGPCQSGWCRTEYCRRCGGGAGNPAAYQCQNQAACQDTAVTSLCLNNCP